jgi:PAS domain S-box-containing protein
VLKALLEHESFTVLCAYTGRAALQYAHQHHPMLLFLDQELPLIDGLELCRILRRESDDPAIILLYDRPDEFGKILAFSAGADDCLDLPYHPQELLARAKAVLRRSQRHTAPAQPILRRGELELDMEQRQLRAAGKEVVLTGIEYELLSLMMRSPRRVFSREQLIAQIPGFHRSSPLDRAVDIHISNLRRKLHQALGAAAPIESVRGVGYRLAGTEPDPLPGQSLPSELPSQLALAAFELTPTPLMVLDRDRTIILYNEAARRLCGWPADEVVGQAKCYSLLGCHREEDGTLLCHDRCILHTGALAGVDDQDAFYSITLKDGREVPVQAHYTNLGNPGGHSTYTLLALDPSTHTSSAPGPQHNRTSWSGC